MERHISYPFKKEELTSLRAGDTVYISGIIYTARDAAHKKMSDRLDEMGIEKDLSDIIGDKKEEIKKRANKSLPISLDENIIYYVGPSPARAGAAVGSAGPTTSSRMDKYTPRFLDLGLYAMIGKGKRNKEVKEAIIRNQAVYFAAVGGAGALLSKSIKKATLIAYEELQTEAIRKLEVENLPTIVVIDSVGNALY